MNPCKMSIGTDRNWLEPVVQTIYYAMRHLSLNKRHLICVHFHLVQILATLLSSTITIKIFFLFTFKKYQISVGLTKIYKSRDGLVAVSSSTSIMSEVSNMSLNSKTNSIHRSYISTQTRKSLFQVLNPPNPDMIWRLIGIYLKIIFYWKYILF